MPDDDAVVTFAPAPVELTGLTPAEWAVLALTDGIAQVAQLLERSGRGEHALLVALVGLMERQVLRLGTPTPDPARRAQLLARAEESTTLSAARSGACAAAC